ncbi:MAG: Hint domain-containing protein [Planctomycetia bacterium]|nr:Hint domain-containing protein [Planctomycetia bacterium]
MPSNCSHTVTRGYQGFSDSLLRRLEKAFPEAEFHEAYPEPCHPGCFPRGTLVDTPTGPRPIETIVPGDYITVVRPDGETAAARVQSVFVTVNTLWKVDTEDGALVTTQTQPLYLAAGETLQAGNSSRGIASCGATTQGFAP